MTDVVCSKSKAFIEDSESEDEEEAPAKEEDANGDGTPADTPASDVPDEGGSRARAVDPDEDDEE